MCRNKTSLHCTVLYYTVLYFTVLLQTDPMSEWPTHKCMPRLVPADYSLTSHLPPGAVDELCDRNFSSHLYLYILCIIVLCRHYFGILPYSWRMKKNKVNIAVTMYINVAVTISIIDFHCINKKLYLFLFLVSKISGLMEFWLGVERRYLIVHIILYLVIGVGLKEDKKSNSFCSFFPYLKWSYKTGSFISGISQAQIWCCSLRRGVSRLCCLLSHSVCLIYLLFVCQP